MALSADASFRKINAGDEKAVYAFVREKGNEKVLVILNLSNSEQSITIKDKTLLRNARNVFKGTVAPLSNKEWKMKPWGYEVYEYTAN